MSLVPTDDEVLIPEVMCRAVMAQCECVLPVHAADVPHECAGPCNGSWIGEGDDFRTVRLPGGGDALMSQWVPFSIFGESIFGEEYE